MQNARDWIIEAGALLDSGRYAQARDALLHAEAQAGEDAGIYRALAIGYRNLDMPTEAVTAEMAALAYEQRSSTMLYNIGAAFLMTQRNALAEKWLRAALHLDPELLVAHQNLATILEMQGQREQAQWHRDQAYSRQNLFIEAAVDSKHAVLLLCASATGNVPFDYLLPQATTTRIKWIMDYANDAQIAELPYHDIVFNIIGDYDVSAKSRGIVQRFLASHTRPVLNLPIAIARTTREQMPLLLEDIAALVAPHVARVAGEKLKEYLCGALSPSCLIRPVGAHGGQGLQLIEHREEVEQLSPQDAEYYVTTFHDFRSNDDYYRKYRVIFVDRKPYPYHLAIASQWLVHYVNADMLEHAWKLQEEERFLREPEEVLGAQAMLVLREIGQRIDLDFCGIDFSLLPDGRLLLFEANATMLVHTEDYHPALAFKNIYVQRILDAFDAMLCAREQEGVAQQLVQKNRQQVIPAADSSPATGAADD